MTSIKKKLRGHYGGREGVLGKPMIDLLRSPAAHKVFLKGNHFFVKVLHRGPSVRSEY